MMKMYAVEFLKSLMKVFFTTVFWVFVGFIGFLLLLAALTSDAKSHEWYDSDCCSERDCAPIIEMKFLPNGFIWFKTAIGEATTNENTKIRGTQDDKEHGCILLPVIYDENSGIPPMLSPNRNGGTAICLYLKAMG